MSWRDDNDQYFSEVTSGNMAEPLAGECEMCARPCLRCQIPMHQHTQAGLTECAWRGYPCLGCGNPPHPDNAPGRCASYDSPGDEVWQREMRKRTPWRRDADGPFYYWRHCNHRRHGHRQPDPEPRVYEIRWPAPSRPAPDRQQLAAEQAAEARAARVVLD